MIYRKNFFDQPVKNYLMIYENIRKIATGQGDNYTIIIIIILKIMMIIIIIKIIVRFVAIDLSNQQALDADPKAIQQVNVTRNLYRGGQTTMYFIIEEPKETILDFSQGTAKVL